MLYYRVDLPDQNKKHSDYIFNCMGNFCTYHLLRVHGIKVFSKKFLENQPSQKKEYLTFKMDHALELLGKKTPKNLIDGMTNIEWRYRKRQEILSKTSDVLDQSNKYFEKYKKQAEERQRKIAQLDGDITKEEEKFSSSIRNGTMSGNMKQLMRQLIGKLKKERDVEMSILDNISKNWDVAIRK